MLEQNHNVQILMKKQIHIMSDAILNYNKSALALQANERKLNENILKFNQFANKTAVVLNSLAYYQTIEMHAYPAISTNQHRIVERF